MTRARAKGYETQRGAAGGEGTKDWILRIEYAVARAEAYRVAKLTKRILAFGLMKLQKL
jgi:hypothetical protein